MSKRLINLLIVFLFACQLMAQNLTVKGRVTDVNAEPIIGASIVGSGNNATVTDINGDFTLKANMGDRLVISYMGFTTKTVTVKGSAMSVVLEESNSQLDEVVVVGTVMKKSDLTGAVAGVSAKTLEEKPVTSINEALQGRVAGVFISNPTRITDDASIKIRGCNTINGSTDPIFVVDGMVMDNSFSGFNAVNLDDVESVEVLKDASATALYGSRGSNGVVVITTKKGKKGEGRVSYNGWIGIQSWGHQPKTMGTKELFELRKEAYTNGYTQTHPQGNVNEYVNGTIMGSNTVFADYEFESYKNNQNYNWLDEVDRTGWTQNHDISFSNASDKGSAYVSLGFTDANGLIKKSEQRKYTGRVNIEYYIKSWLKIGTNTSFTRTEKTIVDDGVMNRARNANPMLPISEDILTLNWQGVFDQNNFNPIRSLRVDDDRVINRVLSSSFLNIEFMKGLDLRSTLSLDYATQQVNRYTPSDIYESERYGTNGEAVDNRDNRTVWQWDNSLSYNKTFGDHRISAMIGTSATKTSYSYINGSSQGYLSNLLGYKSLGSGYKKDQRGLSSDWSKQVLMSYIGRVAYSYKDRYMVTGTIRRDGSSKFAKGHRWGWFPSISLAWDMAQENFIKQLNVFDQLKLRAGFGMVGNQNISDYAYLSLYNMSYSGNVDKGYVASWVSNGRRGTPDIKWEKQKQWNLGVDMAFWNNRLSMSIDAFYIKNSDLLMSHSLPTTTGFSSTIENIGAIDNKGIEMSFKANLIHSNGFDWNVAGTWSLDRNRVGKLYGNTRVIYNVDNDRNIQNEGNLFIGQSRNTLYMWKCGGIAQQSDMDRLSAINYNGYNVNPGDLYIVDVNDDKEIDQNDRVVIGSTDPKYYGGFSTDASWRGLSLNAVFSYSVGARKISPWYNTLISSVGTSVATTDLADRWTTEHTNAKFPRVITGFDYNHYNPTQSDFCVQKASFLRLSALTLAYTFPQGMVQKLKLSNLRVYFTGSNLFCITGYKGYDPETGDWYPSTRMYTFGVNLSF
jgi:TonB-linked SusC/RagA family outer membrane protein